MYYKDQIKTALDGSDIKLKIINSESNDTNWINLNKESIDALINELRDYQKTLYSTPE